MLHARLLTYLDEVVRQGSVRKAAERLNVSASAISRQILALEEQIGAPLFDRSGRRLVPTAAGELLVRHVRETMREMGRTQAQIEELRGLRRGSVGIGLMSGLAANIVPRAIVAFRKTNPRVQLKLRLMTSGDEILEAVEKGDIALGLGFDFPRRPHIRVVHAATGRLGAVMSPDHPLAGSPTLRLADCVAYPLTLADDTTVIRPYIDQAFERSNLEPIPAAETNSIEIMRHMAMIGEGITFLTPFDIEAERRDGRLVHVPVHELARPTQRLMLVENERRANALASLFAERLKVLIDEAS
jgi:DNA-binding transcriptional LysR family regulator